MSTPAILSARGVSRTYRGTGAGVGVLKDVSLEVAEGQVVCIVGASGAGKSTLLHILGSLDRPDSGFSFSITSTWLGAKDPTAERTAFQITVDAHGLLALRDLIDSEVRP
jgi:ABC-type lipoprotein export system ATPase subunit